MWKRAYEVCRTVVEDATKPIGFLAPILSISFTLAKAFAVEMDWLQELSYAWAFLPLTFMFVIAYARKYGQTGKLDNIIKEYSSTKLHLLFGDPSICMTGFFEKYDDDFMCIIFQNCLITNRSDRRAVSLKFTLHVPLKDNCSGNSVMHLEEEKTGPFNMRLGEAGSLSEVNEHLHEKKLKEYQFLHCPIEIEPNKTITGNMGFLIDIFSISRMGGHRNVFNIIEISSLELEVFDYISGAKLVFEVPGSFSETFALNSGEQDGAR